MDRAEKNSAAFAAHIQTPFGVQALTLLAVVAAWEFIGRTGLLFPELFPSVLEILQSLWLYISTPLMIPHIKASLYEIGGALALAALCGVPLGILWGQSAKLAGGRRAAHSLCRCCTEDRHLSDIYFIPGYRRSVQACGRCHRGVFSDRAVDHRRHEGSQESLRRRGAHGRRQPDANRHPCLLAGNRRPGFSGIRIGMGAAVTGALLAERRLPSRIGFQIVEYYGQFRIADMYSLLLFVFILAALTNWAMKRLFARLSPLARVNQDVGMYI